LASFAKGISSNNIPVTLITLRTPYIVTIYHINFPQFSVGQGLAEMQNEGPENMVQRVTRNNAKKRNNDSESGRNLN
jgi:hypothetical protein